MNSKQVFRTILMGIAVISTFGFVCVGLFRITWLAAAIFFLVIFLYILCMMIKSKSVEQIREYEIIQASARLTKSGRAKILFFCLTTLSPIYFVIFLASTVPIFSKEAWFVTIFPCLVIGSIVMISVMDKYRELTGKRWPFLLLYGGVVLALMLLGMAVPSLLI